MNFSEIYRKVEELSSYDQALAEEAVSVVKILPRPRTLQKDAVYEGEVLCWTDVEPSNLLQYPWTVSGSRIPFLSDAGFYYLLPVLLAVGLMCLNTDYRLAVVGSHKDREGASAPSSRAYGLACSKLLGRWIEERIPFVDYRTDVEAQKSLESSREFFEWFEMDEPTVISMQDLEDFHNWSVQLSGNP